MLTFKKISVNSDDAQLLLGELNESLMKILGHNGTMHLNLSDFEKEKSAFIVGYDGDIPVCCAGLRKESEKVCEVKRVYARKNSCGYGRQLMTELERLAFEMEYDTLILECREKNIHAIEFYKSVGYEICDSYPPYDKEDDAVCMKKNMKRYDSQ